MAREVRKALLPVAVQRDLAQVTEGDPVFITENGIRQYAVIAAADWHDPRKCCCKNCPWGGDHG